MKLEHCLTPYRKINSKWIDNLNVRPDTMKILEEINGRIICDINYKKKYFPVPSYSNANKKKNEKKKKRGGLN